jgi:hypothetical protein
MGHPKRLEQVPQSILRACSVLLGLCVDSLGSCPGYSPTAQGCSDCLFWHQGCVSPATQDNRAKVGAVYVFPSICLMYDL